MKSVNKNKEKSQSITLFMTYKVVESYQGQ